MAPRRTKVGYAQSANLTDDGCGLVALKAMKPNPREIVTRMNWLWIILRRQPGPVRSLSIHRCHRLERRPPIRLGQLFMPLYGGFQYSVAALARSGVDVLVDDLTLDGLVDQQRWNNALQGLDVCWIGVRCAPQIAAERESRRGTRLPGIARHQAESVHAGVHYDVEVDTDALDLYEELSVIAEALWRRWSLRITTESSPKPTLPPTSAWMPEGVIRPAPWES